MTASDPPTISEDDARTYLEAVCQVARVHTDIIIAVPEGGGNARSASCLHLDVDGHQVVLTCAHVLRAQHVYYSNPRRLPKDVVDEIKYQTPALSLLASSAELDLAVFDGNGLIQSQSGKVRYPVAHSDWFSRDRLSPPDGTAAFVYGLLGSKSRSHQYEDGLLYMQAPIYSAMGPLVEVADNELIGDFAEKNFLTLNDKAFPQLAGEVPTGGVREIGGTSGSGLWMILDKTPSLLGIVLGRRSSPAGTHLVRAMPIWSALTWIRAELAAKCPSS